MAMLTTTSCALTHCTRNEGTDDSYREILIGMIPDLPIIPSFPKLEWGYDDGMYWIDEDDADRLLDYGENLLPTYRWEIEKYREQLNLVLDKL